MAGILSTGITMLVMGSFIAGSGPTYLPLVSNGASEKHQQVGQFKAGETLGVFEISFDEYLAGGHTLDTMMFTDADGKGVIGCDVYVEGDFDLSRSYCKGLVTGKRSFLKPDAFARSRQYYATLSGLDPDEEVKVVLVSPNGVPYEVGPRLNSGSDSQGLTPGRYVSVKRQFVAETGQTYVVRKDPKVSLTLDDILCDGPFEFCMVTGDEGAHDTQSPIFKINLRIEGDSFALSGDYTLSKGQELNFGDTTIRLEDALTVRSSSLSTFKGMPQYNNFVPGFFIEMSDQDGNIDAYLVGFNQDVEDNGDGFTITLSGQALYLADDTDRQFWMDTVRNNSCVKVPVNLSWPGRGKLTALRSPSLADCLDPDLVDDEVYPYGPSPGSPQGFYLGANIYYLGGDPMKIKFNSRGEMRVTFEGASIFMPGTWYPDGERYWRQALDKGCLIRFPINTDVSNAEERLWSLPNLGYNCP